MQNELRMCRKGLQLASFGQNPWHKTSGLETNSLMAAIPLSYRRASLHRPGEAAAVNAIGRGRSIGPSGQPAAGWPVRCPRWRHQLNHYWI